MSRKNRKAAVQPSQVAPFEDDYAQQQLPPHMSVEKLSQGDLNQLAMRNFGRRPDESKPLAEQAEQVKGWMRGGRPSYH